MKTIQFNCAATSNLTLANRPETGHSILIADDELDLWWGLVLPKLAAAGYRLTLAQDGEQAWRNLEAGSYDLLITDYRMPKLSGLELIERIRSTGSVMPVFVASSALPLNQLERIKHLKVEAAFQKPVKPALLLEQMDKALGPSAGLRLLDCASGLCGSPWPCGSRAAETSTIFSGTPGRIASGGACGWGHLTGTMNGRPGCAAASQ